MHPIFAMNNRDRMKEISRNIPLSMCLHEAGHFLVARAIGVQFNLLRLSDFLHADDAVHDNVRAEDSSAVMINRAGLSERDLISIVLGGYVGELCLYDESYIKSGGAYFTRIVNTANDAAELARIQPRLRASPPRTHREIEKLLIDSLKAVQHRPYLLLARNLKGFRESVSNLHARWEAVKFRALVGADNLFLPEQKV